MAGPSLANCSVNVAWYWVLGCVRTVVAFAGAAQQIGERAGGER